MRCYLFNDLCLNPGFGCMYHEGWDHGKAGVANSHSFMGISRHVSLSAFNEIWQSTCKPLEQNEIIPICSPRDATDRLYYLK